MTAFFDGESKRSSLTTHCDGVKAFCLLLASVRVASLFREPRFLRSACQSRPALLKLVVCRGEDLSLFASHSLTLLLRVRPPQFATTQFIYLSLGFRAQSPNAMKTYSTSPS